MLFCISIGKKAISSIERIEYIQICDKQDVKHGKSKKKRHGYECYANIVCMLGVVRHLLIIGWA